MPGAGNLTCYDNGYLERGQLRASRSIEIDRDTRKLVWQSTRFKDKMPLDFGRKHFSDLVGSAQKLPNGNMMMCEGTGGRIFQVTDKLEEVWEYLNPFSEDELFRGAVFKAQCYAPDYCPQFKDLPPAAGPAIVPAVASFGKQAVHHTESAPDSPVLQGSPWMLVAGVAVAAALLAFVTGLLLGKRNRVATGPAKAEGPSEGPGTKNKRRRKN